MIDIPVKTLRRHLVKEGSSYPQRKDEYRRDIAIEYLSQSDISMTSAALMMGFEELSAFHRSLKNGLVLPRGNFAVEIISTMGVIIDKSINVLVLAHF